MTLTNSSGRWRWFNLVLNLMAILAGLILLFMIFLVCYDVIMRYIFRNPTGWAMEVCEYLLVYITFLGGPWLLREKGHVNVDILFFFFPKLRHRFTLFTNLAASVAAFILFIFSLGATWDYYQRGITMIKMLTVPKWVIFWVIPLGCLLLSIEAARQFYVGLTEKQPVQDLKHQSSEVEK